MSPRTRPTSPHVLHVLAALTLLASLTIGLQAPAGSQVQGSLPGTVSTWTTATGTDGRVYIADEMGRARQFHGFNHKTTDPDTATDELMDQAVARGLDHMRLSIYWEFLEPTKGKYDQGYLDRILAAVERAQKHGLLVILDMHQDVYGPAFDGDGMPLWATKTDGAVFKPQATWLLNYLQPAVQNAFEHLYEDADLREAQKQAWLTVVNKVKDNPAILGYDLMNEPFGKIRAGEDLFSAAARVEKTQLTPMYQRLTDAISAVDSNHWVFIEPPNLASLGVSTSLGPVRGPKVALYPHMYDASIESATYTPGGVIKYDPDFFAKWEGAIGSYVKANPMPMLVGEWGLAHPDGGGMDQFVRAALATLDRTTSGWSVFNWCEGSGYCPIDQDGQDRPGIGQIFEPYARAIAGAPTSSHWDAATANLTVTFDDDSASGTTDVFIPESRSYPKGWEVETTDADGSWSHTFDEATGTLSVTTPHTGGTHTICLKPAGSEPGCKAFVEPAQDGTSGSPPSTSLPVSAPPPASPVPAAPPALPVESVARFTG